MHCKVWRSLSKVCRYTPLATSFTCCEIGCLAVGVTGNGVGDLVFSTRPNNTNVVVTERMRINYQGKVSIEGNTFMTGALRV